MTDLREVVHDRMRAAIADSLEGLQADAAIVALIEGYLERPAGMARARLLAEIARAYSGPTADADPPEAIVDLAAATEILHLLALIHDDAIDADGGERAERAARRLPQASGPYRAAVAILSGDLVHAIGAALFAEAVDRHGLDRRILEEVRTVSVRTILGQAQDRSYLGTTEPASRVPPPASSPRPSFARLYELYDTKTGWYTVAAPLRIGALTAGVSDAELAGLTAVALPLGRAYQLRDDLEDLLRLLSQNRPQDFPAWERNLAATWLGSACASVLTVDAGELTADVTCRIADLCAQASKAARALHLRSGSPDALARRLREILRL